jgi:hypothetical protein
MGRLVGAKGNEGFATDSAQGPVGAYFERVAKYIPAEMVAAYMLIKDLPPAINSGKWPSGLYVAIYVAMIGLTILYLHLVSGPAPKKGFQILLACIAFLLWSYAIGGPFFPALEQLAGWHLVYEGLGDVLVILAAVAFGFFKPS